MIDKKLRSVCIWLITIIALVCFLRFKLEMHFEQVRDADKLASRLSLPPELLVDTAVLYHKQFCDFGGSDSWYAEELDEAHALVLSKHLRQLSEQGNAWSTLPMEEGKRELFLTEYNYSDEDGECIEGYEDIYSLYQRTLYSDKGWWYLQYRISPEGWVTDSKNVTVEEMREPLFCFKLALYDEVNKILFYRHCSYS